MTHQSHPGYPWPRNHLEDWMHRVFPPLATDSQGFLPCLNSLCKLVKPAWIRSLTAASREILWLAFVRNPTQMRPCLSLWLLVDLSSKRAALADGTPRVWILLWRTKNWAGSRQCLGKLCSPGSSSSPNDFCLHRMYLCSYALYRLQEAFLNL